MDGQFRTRDLYFAAFLKVAAVPMLPNEYEAGVAIFVFEDPDGIVRQLKDEYYSDFARVKALSYTRALKMIKSSIHPPRPQDA